MTTETTTTMMRFPVSLVDEDAGPDDFADLEIADGTGLIFSRLGDLVLGMDEHEARPILNALMARYGRPPYELDTLEDLEFQRAFRMALEQVRILVEFRPYEARFAVN